MSAHAVTHTPATASASTTQPTGLRKAGAGQPEPSSGGASNSFEALLMQLGSESAADATSPSDNAHGAVSTAADDPLPADGSQGAMTPALFLDASAANTAANPDLTGVGLLWAQAAAFKSVAASPNGGEDSHALMPTPTSVPALGADGAPTAASAPPGQATSAGGVTTSTPSANPALPETSAPLETAFAQTIGAGVSPQDTPALPTTKRLHLPSTATDSGRSGTPTTVHSPSLFNPSNSVGAINTANPTGPVGLATDRSLDKPFQPDPPGPSVGWGVGQLAGSNGLRHTEGGVSSGTGVYQGSLSCAPDSPAFPAALVSEVRWLLKGALQQAELRMDPEELGPIQINLSVHAQVADIGFTAANAATREGIAQSLPQLRDMLGQQGLSLGHTSVGSENAGQQPGAQEPHRALPVTSVDLGPDHTSAPLRVTTAAPRRPGGLDLYA